MDLMLLLLTQIVATTTAFRGVSPSLTPRSSTVRLFSSEKGFGNKVARPSKKASKKPPPSTSTANAQKSATKAPLKTIASSDEKTPTKSSQEDIFRKYGVQEASQQQVVEERPAPSFVDVVPGSVQLGLERFFIGGIVLLLFAFVAIGIAITIDAFAVSSKQPLPEEVRHLIVDIMEPAFTPTLFAGFACSISLGLLKILQLSSDKVQYTEYKED